MDGEIVQHEAFGAKPQRFVEGKDEELGPWRDGQNGTRRLPGYHEIPRSDNGEARRRKVPRSETASSSSREEHGISHAVFARPLRIIPRRIEVLPQTGRVNVLVALVPPPIDDSGQRWVVVVSFELRVGNSGFDGDLALGGQLGMGCEMG